MRQARIRMQGNALSTGSSSEPFDFGRMTLKMIVSNRKSSMLEGSVRFLLFRSSRLNARKTFQESFFALDAWMDLLADIGRSLRSKVFLFQMNSRRSLRLDLVQLHEFSCPDTSRQRKLAAIAASLSASFRDREGAVRSFISSMVVPTTEKPLRIGL